jgi:hypothetical protein
MNNSLSQRRKWYNTLIQLERLEGIRTMAVTEAEKRKLLRERRAAKIANSSARLNRITGDEKPEDAVPELPRETKEPVDTNQTKKSSNRISQNFEDPPIQDIESITELNTSTGVGNNGESMADFQKEFQQSLEQLLKSVKHEHGGSNPAFDMFNIDQLASIPDLNGSGGADTANEKDIEERLIQKKLNDKFKAQFMLVKLMFVPLIIYICMGSNRFNNSDFNESLFIKFFTTFEVLSTSIYTFRLIKTPDNEYNYSKLLDYVDLIPQGIVAQHWKQKTKLLFKYLELIQFVLFDMSAVIVVFGLLSLF